MSKVEKKNREKVFWAEYKTTKYTSDIAPLSKVNCGQLKFLGIWHRTPSLSHNFAVSEKKVLVLT